MAVLFVVGHGLRWTRYRTVAALLATGHAAALAGYTVMLGTHPAATMLVCGGFVLLAGGAMISWHKPGLAGLVDVQKFDLPTAGVPAFDMPALDVPVEQDGPDSPAA